MGDSDDEFNRRRRDKFRRERDDIDRREERPRGPWEERGRMSWDKRDRRDFNNRDMDRRRDRYSPNGRDDISPPVKRFRGTDWDNRGGNYGHHDGGYQGQGSWGNQGDMGPPNPGYGNQVRGQEPDYPTQPPMMSFKQFLSSQDDNISDDDAIKKFNEYKIDFKKQQINEFFLVHKEEDWFKAKYHPEEYDQHLNECKASLKQRCAVFVKLLELARVEKASLDTDKSDEVVRLLDAAVILMEGGTEFDLNFLDMEPSATEETSTRRNSESAQQSDSGKADREEGEEKGSDDDDDDKKSETPMEEGESRNDEPTDKKSPKKSDVKEKKKKKKRDYNYESGSDSDSGSSSDSDAESGALGDDDAADEVNDTTTSEPPAEKKPETQDSEEKEEKKKEEDEEKQTAEEKDKDTQEDGEHSDQPKPQAFHKTHSIFLRNLAPSITKLEVEAMCKRFPGFLRVSLQDPQPERRFFRRGWVTFDRTVNIKDICWNLNNIRLRDCEMGAIVNRELKQRIRPISGITAHKTITKQDIKHAAKIVQNFDNRWSIWSDEDEKKDEEKEPKLIMGLVSNNPVLKNITDYLVDEGSYEEEAYFGGCADDKQKDGTSDVSIERDEELCKVLDRMILYLRIVHSFDFYSCVEYPNEDEMPHRCGILHARGASPPSKISEHELTDWNHQFESRIMPFLNYRWQLDDKEAVRLGKKDHEAEVEKFITDNTQELAKDKWLCPLSGKKFKGPEFVRKHLQNKHAKEIEEVRQEATYFNNYLLDPKRPSLPEHPASRQGGAPGGTFRQDSGPGGQGATGGYQGGGGYRGNMSGGGGYGRPMYTNNYQGRGGNRGQRRGFHQGGYHNRGGGHDNYRQDYRRDRGSFYNRRDRGRQDPRGIIEYRDLDAPEDNDMF